MNKRKIWNLIGYGAPLAFAIWAVVVIFIL
jgi:hypothetical protein